MKNRNFNLLMNCDRASERGVGASRPSASPCGCPAIQNRAHFPREGISIRRTICLAPNARADCAIQFAALHQQACAWLLWRADATIDNGHRLVLGRSAARSRDRILQTVLSSCRSERGQAMGALVR